MTLANLTESERDIVFECLRCVASGEIIKNDSEFQTIFGIEFSELLEIVGQLPAVDESSELVRLAINNSLNNLLGYPHRGESKWARFISVPPSEVGRIFAKWQGVPVANYFEGVM